jgi:hypothetical protein
MVSNNFSAEVNMMKQTIPIDPQLVRDLRLAVADLKGINP